MQATIFIPILSVIALIIKAVTGYEIGEEVIQQVADLLVTVSLGVIGIVGIIKTYSKKAKDSYNQKNKK